MSHDTKILLSGLAFPEGPRWRDDRLWFTDQHAREVCWVTLAGEKGVVAEMPDLPGGLGWLPNGNLLVVSMTERKLYEMGADGLSLYADLSSLASFHCNDMLLDSQGRAYVGNFGYDLHGGAAIKPAELILVDANARPRVVSREVIFPNGMALSNDGHQLIVGETFAHRLSQFQVAEDGSLFDHQIWADLGDAAPDGICLDAEGAIWVASPATDEVIRVRQGGEVLQRVRPVGTPYACMLGGIERKTLFVLSAETDDPAQAAALRSGRIELIEVAVPGDGLP
jgi:sugar lactone lactonase YvrE